MPPAFILLVIIGVIILWFLLSSLYKPIGKLIYMIGKDAIDIIKNKDKKENDKYEG